MFAGKHFTRQSNLYEAFLLSAHYSCSEVVPRRYYPHFNRAPVDQEQLSVFDDSF